MAISECAKDYHKKMFGGLKYNFYKTDPEFTEKFANFTFDKMIKECDLDERTRFLVILASIIGCNGIDEYEVMLNAALNCCIKPIEVKEIVYQAVFTLGIGRTFSFLRETNRIFEQNGIEMPLKNDSNEHNQENINCEKNEIIENIEDNRNKDLILSWKNEKICLCKNLKNSEIEMVELCFLISSSACEEQVKECIENNTRAGNSEEFLRKITLQMMPFIGYLNEKKYIKH